MKEKKKRKMNEINTGALIASDMKRPKYKILYTLIVLYLGYYHCSGCFSCIMDGFDML